MRTLPKLIQATSWIFSLYCKSQDNRTCQRKSDSFLDNGKAENIFLTLFLYEQVTLTKTFTEHRSQGEHHTQENNSETVTVILWGEVSGYHKWRSSWLPPTISKESCESLHVSMLGLTQLLQSRVNVNVQFMPLGAEGLKIHWSVLEYGKEHKQ